MARPVTHLLAIALCKWAIFDCHPEAMCLVSPGCTQTTEPMPGLSFIFAFKDCVPRLVTQA